MAAQFCNRCDIIQIMASSNALQIYRQLEKQGIRLLDYGVLSQITGYTKKNTLYKLADKLVENDIITKLTSGKFLVNDAGVGEFEVANYIYQPSYISLESALSYYGILAQFPYSVTSVTTRKSRKMQIKGKEYVYSTIKSGLFNGYVKLDTFLMASAEKALVDMAYFNTKGISNIDLSELDLSSIDRTKLRDMARMYNGQVNRYLEEIYD